VDRLGSLRAVGPVRQNVLTVHFYGADDLYHFYLGQISAAYPHYHRFFQILSEGEGLPPIGQQAVKFSSLGYDISRLLPRR
jgi:hypothetical protein